MLIKKPLPEETYLSPNEDLNMGIKVSASRTFEADIIISLGRSSRGVYEDLTQHITYNVSEDEYDDVEKDDDGEDWIVDITVPYPYSQASGDLTLSVGDSHSGDITSTRLIIRQDENEFSPYFDPVPRSVESHPGKDVFIPMSAMGSLPINVSFIRKFICSYIAQSVCPFVGLINIKNGLF